MSGYTDGLDGKGVARQKQAAMGMIPSWAAAPYRGYTVVHGSLMRIESGTTDAADAEKREGEVASGRGKGRGRGRGRPQKKPKQKNQYSNVACDRIVLKVLRPPGLDDAAELRT